MIVKVANKTLKQPMEIYIDDKEWEEIEAIENRDELNSRLASIAMKQVSQHGYNIGFCEERKKSVTLRECMKCGLGKGWGAGEENMTKWEMCKKEQINYVFAPGKVLTNTIKDKKLAEKMQPQSKAQRKADNQTYSETPSPVRADESFEKQSENVMKPIRDKENK